MLLKRLREKRQMQNPDKKLSLIDLITDKENFSRSLRAARFGKTYQEYIRYIELQVVYIALAMVGFIVVMQLLAIRFTVLKPFPVLVQYAIILIITACPRFSWSLFPAVACRKRQKSKNRYGSSLCHHLHAGIVLDAHPL